MITAITSVATTFTVIAYVLNAAAALYSVRVFLCKDDIARTACFHRAIAAFVLASILETLSWEITNEVRSEALQQQLDLENSEDEDDAEPTFISA